MADALAPPPLAAGKPAEAASGATAYHRFVYLTPYLWLLGILTPSGAFILVRLAITAWPRSLRANALSLAWIGIGLMQAFCTLCFGIWSGQVFTGLRNMASFGVTGWVFAGLAIAAGAAHRLDRPKCVKATAWLGVTLLALSATAAFFRSMGLRQMYIWPTPFGQFLPQHGSAEFYTAALLYQTEETFGEGVTRLVAFFPYTTALGLGATAIALISLEEKHRLLRLLGALGAFIAVVFSWSRIAIFCAVVSIVLRAFLGLPASWRFALLCLGAGILAVLPVFGFDYAQQVQQMMHDVDSVRSGSSLARELIYQKSYEGFLQSPVFGNGWIGDSVHPTEDLPIGSHSTIYGLLYTGGLLTFATFAATMALTFALAIVALLRTRFGTPARSRAITTLCLVVSLALYSRYESLFNLSLPCLVLFTWIGATISAPGHRGPAPNFQNRITLTRKVP